MFNEDKSVETEDSSDTIGSFGIANESFKLVSGLKKFLNFCKKETWLLNSDLISVITVS